jgi:hypothetical protein
MASNKSQTPRMRKSISMGLRGGLTLSRLHKPLPAHVQIGAASGLRESGIVSRLA